MMQDNFQRQIRAPEGVKTKQTELFTAVCELSTVTDAFFVNPGDATDREACYNKNISHRESLAAINSVQGLS